MDGKEIAAIVEPLDELQLMLDQPADFVCDALWKAVLGPFPCKFFEVLLWRTAIRDHLLGIFIAQLAEAEPAAFDDFEAALDRALMAAK